MTGGLTCIIPSHLTPKRQARVLAHHRAKLVFATRDLAATAAEKVVANIKAETPIAEMYERSGDFLPLAGIMPPPFEGTVDGFETQFSTNHTTFRLDVRGSIT
ncbi:hypothetical protein BC936DRAFT_138545 [Jimgerdemannia flammicorona]|uniref:Uncharacterized protein n=1 Tax=Jimgerdemannia flammicorona TaxID=994334 RepID=A0A433C688_9FUNG|nr:hypothetical protein BC936DRAFT_138545 [Jimgerdemannia flammicorona]